MLAGTSRGKYKKYDIKLKLEFCKKNKEFGNIAKTRREMDITHIDYTVVREWVKKEAELLATSQNFSRQHKANKSRIAGGGRKPALGVHELEVFNEIMDMRNQKIRVTRFRVFKIAIDVANRHEIVGFKATSRWISGFFKRFRLSLRRQSSLQTLSDEEIIKRSVKFLRYMSHVFSAIGYFEAGNIVAMDETAVYFASSQSATVDITNSKSIIVKGTGFESERITCVLKDDGRD